MTSQQSYAYDLSVVIVSFNTREVLRECLLALARESDGLRVQTIAVDNGSRDGSIEMLRADFPSVELIVSPENLGFGRANNLAFEQALGRYIVLLNSDAFLTPDSLRRSVEHMDADPRVGLGGGRLIGRDGGSQPSARRFPTLITDTFVYSGLADRYAPSRIFGCYNRTWADPMQPAEVDWVPGAYSILRPQALRAARGVRFALLPVLRRSRSLPPHQGGRLHRLVLAGHCRHPHWWRVVTPVEITSDVPRGRATHALAHAQYAALLPQASWALQPWRALSGSGMESLSRPAPQPQSRPATPPRGGIFPRPSRTHGTGMEGNPWRSHLSTAAVVSAQQRSRTEVSVYAFRNLSNRRSRLFVVSRSPLGVPRQVALQPPCRVGGAIRKPHHRPKGERRRDAYEIKPAHAAFKVPGEHRHLLYRADPRGQVFA